MSNVMPNASEQLFVSSAGNVKCWSAIKCLDLKFLDSFPNGHVFEKWYCIVHHLLIVILSFSVLVKKKEIFQSGIRNN